MTEAVFRDARPEDAAGIGELLHQHMNRKLSAETFARIVDYPWQEPDAPHRGQVAEAGGQIVGYHGIIFSHRIFNGASHLMGNFSSLYVHRDWRGSDLGLRMMRRIVSDLDITMTVFDPTKRVHGILEECGFTDIDLYRHVWDSDFRTARPAPEVITGAENILPKLDDPELLRIAADHADLRVRLVLLIDRETGARCLTGFLDQHRGDNGQVLDMIYCSDPAALAKCIDGAAPTLTDRENGRLLIDERFLDGHQVAGLKVRHGHRRMIRPAANPLPGWQVDHMYSETVLMPLKLS